MKGKGPYYKPKTVSDVRKKTAERSRLQQLREESGLGLREMAQYADISPATVVRVEAGKTPDLVTALRFARFYETTVEELFKHFLFDEDATNSL